MILGFCRVAVGLTEGQPWNNALSPELAALYISKGDSPGAPREHFFDLGRSQTPPKPKRQLLEWG
jgi:hypothetical protein